VPPVGVHAILHGTASRSPPCSPLALATAFGAPFGTGSGSARLAHGLRGGDADRAGGGAALSAPILAALARRTALLSQLTTILGHGSVLAVFSGAAPNGLQGEPRRLPRLPVAAFRK
jgi:hypothetical protein